MNIARFKLSTLISFSLASILLGVCLFVYCNIQSAKTVAINGVQYNKIIDQKDLAADVLPPPEYLIETWQLVLQSVAMDNQSLESLEDNISVLRKAFEDRHQYWDKKLQAAEARTLVLQQLYASGHHFFTVYDTKFLPALHAHDKKQIDSALGMLNDAYKTHRNIVDKVVAYTTLSAENLEKETAGAISRNEMANYGMVFLLIAFATAFGYFILSIVKKRLGMDPLALSELAGNFSNGDFSAKIDLDKEDQISVAHSMLILQNTLSALTEESHMLANAALAGQLSTRADATKFKGAFQRLVTGFNQTLDGVILPLNVAASYVEQISRGQIPQKISENYHGDFNTIKENLNQCIDAVNALIADTNRLAQAAVAGHLSTRADASQHHGDFRKIVEGVNHTLDAVILPLNVAAEYVDHISKGQIPAKITDAYPGDFNAIKDNLNQCIHAVNALITDTHGLSDAAVKGQLSQRADASKHQGDFRKIVEGVNATLDSVIGPLHVAADYVARIAQGDIPEPITQAYSGDFNTIKHNLNTCIDAIDKLVSDSAMLAHAAKEGRISVRADEMHHRGDFRKIIHGVNHTLDLIVAPIRVVNEAVEAINTAASEISSGNNQLSQRTEEQAASLEETAASLDQLSSIVKQNADNAQQSNQLARTASSVAETGADVVRQVITTMHAMNESAKKIEDIIAVIDGIAFQTNILALNAAVEAARAGEQGRGFTVVANEVGDLAQRSSIAAKEIKALITDSVQKTYEGTQQVGSAGQTMDEVVAAVNKVSVMINEITAASLEQSQGIEQINKSMNSIDEATQHNAALVEQSAAAAESLLDQSNQLHAAVSLFQLDRTSHSHSVGHLDQSQAVMDRQGLAA